jgi:hypothetical protein
MGAARVFPSEPPVQRTIGTNPVGLSAGQSSLSITQPLSSSSPPNAITTEDDTPRSFFRQRIVLIGLAMVGVALLASLVYYLFFRPPPVTLAPQMVVIPLPTPTVEMVTLPTDSDFASALPESTLTFGLTAIEKMPLSVHATWPARFVEGWILTYEDGSGSTMTVDAYQHYHEDDAITAFEALVAAADTSVGLDAAPSPSPSASVAPPSSLERFPVTADGIQVGESVRFLTTITEEVEEEDATPITRDVARIVWRNATGVFIMTADPSVIDQLFLEFGV